MESWNSNIRLILSRTFQPSKNIGVFALSVFYSCVVTMVPIVIFDFFDEGRQHLGRTVVTMLNSFGLGEHHILLSPAYFVEFYVGSVKEMLASQFGGETIVFLFFFVLVPLSILIFPVLTSKLGNKQRWPFIVLNLMLAFISSYYVYVYIIIGLSPSFL